jgi:riboflavin synthase
VLAFAAVEGDAGRNWRLDVAAPLELARFIAEKGSIAIDGVSLTVNGVDAARFHVNLIPHSLAVTTLRDLAPGARVNLEVDLMARYAARLLEAGGERRET